MTTDRLQLLEVLVDELMKDEPSETVVTKCMTAVGLTDNKDPIDRINQVLKALHFEEPKKDLKE